MAVVVRASGIRSVESEGNVKRVLAGAAVGATESEVWETRMADGAGNPAHTHDAEEIVVVLEGELDVDVGGERRSVGESEVLIIPAGVVHQFRAVGPTRKLTVFGRVGVRSFTPGGAPIETPWQDGA